MATNTKNFNFKKPDESDFYSIQDQNGNWDLADEELQKLNEPAFEDYTTGTSVPSAATALEALKSKIKLPIWMSNVVAFCKGCCTLAMIVNNCVSSDADKPLAAAQGKALQDQLTKLYSDKLDITGGTIQASESVPLVLKNSANDYSYLDFHGKSGRLGMLGMDKMNTPVFYDTNWEIHELALKSDLFSNLIKVTDIHNIRKSCLFRAEYGAANTPTRDVGYIGLSVYVDRTWQFVICSPYAGGKLFFDSVNTSGSWIGWKEIAFK